MPTLSTAPLIILIVVMWYLTKGNLLAIILFTSVFEAASAINVGSLGVSPPLMALLLCLVLKWLRGHRPARFITGINKLPFYLLICFFLYAVCTAVAYPIIFKGVLVMHGSTVAPLTLSVSNFAQICYLLASVILYILTTISSREELLAAVNWYINGCIFSTFVSVWQLANAVIHIPYPDAILYSNPSHVIYRAYMINGMWRLNSTFSEASEFSSYISVAIALLGWQVAVRPTSLWRGSCLVLMVIMLVMTESSLGYICLICSLTLGVLFYTVKLIKRRSIAITHSAWMIAGTIVVMIILAAYGNARQGIVKLVRATLVDKQNSDSYRERTETHAAAIEALTHTYYLGAGWGSMRASGLVFVLLGNVGVIGFLIFVAFYISLAKPLFRSTKLTSVSEYGLYEQCLFGSGIMIIGLVVAGAEPVQPILWVMFGVATVARTPLRKTLLQDHYEYTHVFYHQEPRGALSV